MSQVRVRYTRAEAAMRRGDEAGVKAELEACKSIYEALEAWHGMYGPQYYERRKATESALLLGARARKDKGALEPAVAALKKLIDAGDPFASGPAFDPPAEEWLGDLYLADGKPKEALAAYDAALVKHPRLSRALLGAMRAAKAAGDDKIADARRAELATLWSDADPDIKELLK
jgi:tetratricopeptide (TPR) repeat protein